MKQLTATNNLTGMKIVQRYIEGSRYLKVVPTHLQPLIMNKLKEQFGKRNVEVSGSESGWIKIEKTGEDEELENAAKVAVGKKEVDEDYVLNKEAEILKQQGFAVKIEKID